MKLKELDNIYNKGKKGFVIGGAYNINKISNNIISKLNQEVLVGANKAYKKFNIDYLVFSDPYFHKEFSFEFKDLPCIKLTHLNIPKKLGVKNLIKFKREKNSKYKIVPDNITQPISLKNNSGTLALKIASLLGLNPIYLIGVELNHQDIDDKKFNFHRDYENSVEQRQERVTYKIYDNFFEAFKETIHVLKKRNFEIFSCSETSRLNNIIEYRDLDQILD